MVTCYLLPSGITPSYTRKEVVLHQNYYISTSQHITKSPLSLLIAPRKHEECLHEREPLNMSGLRAGKYFGALGGLEMKYDLSKDTQSILQNLMGLWVIVQYQLGYLQTVALNRGYFLPVRGHLKMSGDIIVPQLVGRFLLAVSDQKPGVFITALQYIERGPTRNSKTPYINNVKIKNPTLEKKQKSRGKIKILLFLS